MRTRVSSQKDLGLCLRPTPEQFCDLGKVICLSWPESPGQRLELSVCTDHSVRPQRRSASRSAELRKVRRRPWQPGQAAEAGRDRSVPGSEARHHSPPSGAGGRPAPDRGIEGVRGECSTPIF